MPGELFPDPFTEDGRIPLRWHPDGQELYVEYISRDRQIFRVVACNRTSGAERVVIEERSEDPATSFVDCTNGKREWQFLRNGSEVLFLSERDGWCHQGGQRLWKYQSFGSGIRLPLHLSKLLLLGKAKQFRIHLLSLGSLAMFTWCIER